MLLQSVLPSEPGANCFNSKPSPSEVPGQPWGCLDVWNLLVARRFADTCSAQHLFKLLFQANYSLVLLKLLLPCSQCPAGSLLPLNEWLWGHIQPSHEMQHGTSVEPVWKQHLPACETRGCFLLDFWQCGAARASSSVGSQLGRKWHRCQLLKAFLGHSVG